MFVFEVLVSALRSPGPGCAVVEKVWAQTTAFVVAFVSTQRYSWFTGPMLLTTREFTLHNAVADSRNVGTGLGTVVTWTSAVSLLHPVARGVAMNRTVQVVLGVVMVSFRVLLPVPDFIIVPLESMICQV